VRSRALFATVLFLVFDLPAVQAQTDWDAVEVRVTPVRGGVHMLTAAGGNMAVFPGRDGTLVVDADYAEMAARILEAIRTVADPTSPSLRFLVNTHWHFDHTSGNAAFAREGATIIAHEGVRRLLSEDQVMHALGDREVPAAPVEAHPVISFNDRLSLELNGDLVHVVHVPPAHTDGDAIVHFRDADVVHLGDLFFNGRYPFIDVDNGGNISGIVAALEDVLAHTPESTLFIPGHGTLADRDGLEAYLDMLRTVRDRVRQLVEEGRTRDEVLAARPTADLEERWLRSPGSGGADFFVGLVYDGMVKRRPGG